ncbi:MAG TPA: hypothetical protein VM370_00160 [Candidatus Thermoplasmatota archaeon]|nr:hypothetical protein [Candidatus Thermoplasmatota archaeon]
MRAPILLLAFTLVPLAASLPAPLGATHPACAGAAAPVLFAQWDSQLENLAFDGAGRLYVSDLGGDRLLQVTTGGAISVVAGLPGMHGLTFGPDGILYAGATVGAGPGVVRFTSLDPPVREEVASGLVAANGMTFDAAGNLFVSNPGLGSGAPYLARLPAGDMAAWSAWGDAYGLNGIWLAGDRIVAAVTADQSSPILSLSTSDPDDVRVVAQLTLGAATLQPGAHAPAGGPGLVPKGLDDLTVGPDGTIYAAAHVAGEILRVDAVSGDACVLASGLEEPTSVRIARGFGAYDGDLFVTDMGGTAVTALVGPGAGAIWRIPTS